MKTLTFVVLSLDEAREALVNFFTSFLVNNPEYLSSLFRHGKVRELPDLAAATPDQVILMYRENGVGAGTVADADGVAVQIGNSLEVVYTKPEPVVQAA